MRRPPVKRRPSPRATAASRQAADQPRESRTGRFKPSERPVFTVGRQCEAQLPDLTDCQEAAEIQVGHRAENNDPVMYCRPCARRLGESCVDAGFTTTEDPYLEGMLNA